MGNSNNKDINTQDKNGNTKLIRRIINDSTFRNTKYFTLYDIIRRCPDLNIQNNDGDTALTIACKKNIHVETLIENGADVNIQNNNGDTALIIACKLAHDIHVKMLIENGADINIQNNNGDAVFDVLFSSGSDYYNREKYNNIIKFLISAGIDINKQNNKGNTILMRLAKCKYHYDTMVLLLKNGANIDIQNDKGETALMIARNNRLWEKVMLLLLEKKEENTEIIGYGVKIIKEQEQKQKQEEEQRRILASQALMRLNNDPSWL